MNKILTTYWIEFETGLDSQYGVTAYSFDDAVSILKQKVFRNVKMPIVKTSVESIKFEDLAQNHIVPDMGVISDRGIWFPDLRGY